MAKKKDSSILKALTGYSKPATKSGSIANFARKCKQNSVWAKPSKSKKSKNSLW